MIEDMREEILPEYDYTSITCPNCEEEITIEYIPDENTETQIVCPECENVEPFTGKVIEVEIY